METVTKCCLTPITSVLGVFGVYQDGLPAPITVGELLLDSAFLDYNAAVKQKIEAALTPLPASVSRKPVPVLFHAKSEDSGMAFVPNAVNSQQINGTTFYARQFGPRDSQEEDVFKRSVESVVGNASGRNVWKYFHTHEGEVHCGSNIERKAEEDWWSEIENQ
jgi:hypothetical protein